MDALKFEPKYLLAEFLDLNYQINDILKSTNRIKYTCFDVSQQLIIFGSTSGGLYIFNRTPCHFLQLIPNQTGSITYLSISHNEDWIAFSCKNGLVHVIQRPSGILPVTPDIQISYEHEGNNVTALRWDFHKSQLYIGDDTGRVSVLNLHCLIGKKILHSSSFLLLELKNPIVQLDTSEELLLVSSITRTVLCNTHRQVFQQIGLRPRHGKYGACFMNSRALGSIYCARPGNRLWEVDLNGSVLCTHKFTDSLRKPSKVIQAMEDNPNNEQEFSLSDNNKLNKGFNKLFPINNKLILTYSSDLIQVLNPSNCEIILHVEYYPNIASCAVYNNILYIFTKSRSFHEIHLMAIEELIAKCYYLQFYCLSSSLSREHEEYLVQCIKQESAFSKMQSVQKIFTKYEQTFNVQAILCELLNYSFGESSNDEIFDDEILFKRDRRKNITEEALHEKDFTPNVIDNIEKDQHSTEHHIRCDNANSNFDNVNYGTEIRLENVNLNICDSVQQSNIENDDPDDQTEKLTELTVVTNECAENNVEEIANKAILNENLLIEKNFAGQTHSLNQLSKNITSDLKRKESNSSSHSSEIKNIDIDADLGFEHLGEADNQRQIEKSYDDAKLNKEYFGLNVFTNVHEVNIMLTEKNIEIIKSLYAVIQETRESQCTIPKKLPKLEDYSSSAIVDLFKKLHDYILFIEGDQYQFAVYDCSKLFLQYVTLNLNMIDSIEVIQDYLINSLISVETSRSKTCICGYPMPQQISKPLFYGLCKQVYGFLSHDLNKRIDLCSKIPYLWHLICDQEKDPSLNILSLIMQLDYKKGFDSLSKSFTEEDYMNVIDYKITLNSKRCLLCFSKFENELHTSELISYNISWNYIGHCMYRAFGGTKTLNMLISKSNEIPNGSLDLEFYHFLMLNP